MTNPFINNRVLDRVFETRMSILLTDGNINSYYRYRSTLHAIQSFAGHEIRVGKVDSRWLQECAGQWESKGLSPTTIRIYMATLKSIFNDLERKGMLKHSRNPFSMYQAPPPVRRRMALSREDIMRIAAWKGSAIVENYRDLWLFSYLCNGINFRDMLFLKYRNIVDGEIVFERAKTKGKMKNAHQIHATLSDRMKEIIDRVGNKNASPDTYIFGYAREGMTPMQSTLMVRRVIGLCNRSLRTISDQLGIAHFTTYSARHSFATILNKNGVDINFISESLGHNSLETTKIYLAGYDKEERRRLTSYLTDICDMEQEKGEAVKNVLSSEM